MSERGAGAGDGSDADADRLIVEAATGAHQLASAELGRILEHVARAGFPPAPNVRAKGLAGIEWQRRILRGSDRITTAEKHDLEHVVWIQEWPPGTTVAGYLDSIRTLILDGRSVVAASRYRGAWQLALLRRSYELRGPAGNRWTLVEYRVGLGRWVTAFQPTVGLRVLRHVERTDLQ